LLRLLISETAMEGFHSVPSIKVEDSARSCGQGKRTLFAAGFYRADAIQGIADRRNDGAF
jgi:hypothetical protein